jgi:hypothetical protein
MKISGFSYVRNGFNYGVPFLEAFQSVLPICDEFIVAVGDSTDGTREALSRLSPGKMKIIDTTWDASLNAGGKIFAQQTNLALDRVTGDWAFHIQADEVIHENDLPNISRALQENQANPAVEGFILPFLHFWGSYGYIRNSRRVHRYEVRLFRNLPGVRSYKDSQGFRKYASVTAYQQGTDNGRKLQVKKIDAPIYHYNGIRPPDAFKKKQVLMRAFYQDELTAAQKDPNEKITTDRVDRVVPFTGSHPAVMQAKVAAQDWEYQFNPRHAEWKLKDRIMQPIEDVLGFKIGEYKNYKLL